MKVALVHDDFVQAGGAESLFATIASLWPEAPIYTSLVNWDKLPAAIDRNRLRPSWLQKIPLATKFYRALLPLYPFAFESFDFDGYDVVISSTTRFAKAIITKPKTVHISYVNSLPRFLYSRQALRDYLPLPLRLMIKPALAWLRRWDKVTSSRADYFIANSQNVAKQISKHYLRKSEVIYPFADLNFFRVAKIHKWRLKSQNYYLIVARLVKWKKIDLAIGVLAERHGELIIVGEGPDKTRLKNLAKKLGSKVQFLGRVTQDMLRTLYQNCQALIVTQEEDFGIATVEAQACGRPVIAFQKGGQTEIIRDGKTGLLFKNQTTDSLQDAIQRHSSLKWTVSKVRINSLRFSKSNFASGIKNKVKKYARRTQRP